jgi:DNA-directed RNA polymerase subunit M/transcription elongation factor TFIIS
MAGVIKVTCPKCKKAMQVPEVLAGKRIRCRGCNATLMIAQREVKQAAASHSAAHHEDEFNVKGTYGVAVESDKPRCPFCAGDIEEGQAVCLTCGYNLLTRERSETRVLYAVSGSDYFLWLLPGIICVLVLLAAAGAIAILWSGVPELGGFLQEYFQEWRWGRVYGTLFFGFVMFFTGRFAYKRLIKNPHPPEIEKHVHDEDRAAEELDEE